MVVHRAIPEEVSIKAFKRVLEGPTQRERDEEDARIKSIQEKFLHADFEELCSIVEQQGIFLPFKIADCDKFNCIVKMIFPGSDLQGLLCHIFSNSNLAAIRTDEKIKTGSILDEPEPYEKIFPELFLY